MVVTASTEPTICPPQPQGQDLDGRVALVTGSSSGIGAAIATSLAQHGATVVVNSATSVAAGEQLAAALPGGSYLQADVSNPDHAARLVSATVEQHGRLDIVVNNAGTTQVIPHHDLDAAAPDVWERIFRVNVVGTWNVIRAAAPHLRQSGAGVILNISSLAGVRPTGSSIPYAVSKAAVNHLTVLLASVLGPEIRVHAVAPGLIDTPWTADWHEVRQQVCQTAPLKRAGTPQDVAEVCIGLIKARYSTGQIALVDGGMGLR